VFRQTGVTLDAFVVDDCPQGSAQEAVRSLSDPRVTYVRNPHPTGGAPGVVRNLAGPRGSGTYVHFLDDDDLVPEGHYAAVRDAFGRGPDVGLGFRRVWLNYRRDHGLLEFLALGASTRLLQKARRA